MELANYDNIITASGGKLKKINKNSKKYKRGT